MDLDAYLAATAPDRVRLDALLRAHRLTGAQSDEVVELYQRVATQLSVVRSSAPDPSVVGHLSVLLASARTRMTGTRTSTWRAVGGFFTHRFPAALYTLRWWWLSMMAANIVVTAVMIWWLLGHPAVEHSLLSQQQIDQLVNKQIQGYYSDYAASHFAAQIWTNNAWVTAISIGMGIFGLPVVVSMFANIGNLALLGTLMTRHHRAELFWGLILPHGLLELTAVFIGGGVGLRIFWSWIEPGARTRVQSLAHAGRTAAGVALGLAAVLAVSGVIEAFVTPSPLPTWARVGIGVVVWVAFMAYVFVVGRAAASHGETGDVDERLLEDRVAVAD
ncbi:MAG: stage II sporulation protein M [Nocardioides sp.]|nr:stage II sporulation protein M [Nocardioides sp.]